MGLELLEEIHDHVHKPMHSLGNYKTWPHTELQSPVVYIAPLLSQVPIQGWPTCASELDHKIYDLNKINERGWLEAVRGLAARFSRRGAYDKPPKNEFLRAESQPFP